MLPLRRPLSLSGAAAASASSRYMKHVSGTRLFALPIALFSRTQWRLQGFWEAADDNLDAGA
jgi:hypothetical protein